jgi:hypothetical protein
MVGEVWGGPGSVRLVPGRSGSLTPLWPWSHSIPVWPGPLFNVLVAVQAPGSPPGLPNSRTGRTMGRAVRASNVPGCVLPAQPDDPNVSIDGIGKHPRTGRWHQRLHAGCWLAVDPAPPLGFPLPWEAQGTIVREGTRSPLKRFPGVLAENRDARLPQTLPDALRDLSPLPLGAVSCPA